MDPLGDRVVLAGMALALLVAGCATEPAPAPGEPELREPPVTRPAPRAGSPGEFERRLRDQALLQARQGSLAEAAVSWEILATLRPDDAEYRSRLAEVRRLIEQAVPKHLALGAELLKRGALNEAEQHYVAALALQPDNAAAASALRDIERDRMRRLVLTRPARTGTAAQRGPAAARPMGPPASAPGRDD